MDTKAMSDDRTPEENPDWTPEELESMREARREYDRGEHLKIHLVSKVEEIKPGQWWVWSCQLEDTAGNMRHAYIQSDGHNHELSTLEYE